MNYKTSVQLVYITQIQIVNQMLKLVNINIG